MIMKTAQMDLRTVPFIYNVLMKANVLLLTIQMFKHYTTIPIPMHYTLLMQEYLIIHVAK